MVEVFFRHFLSHTHPVYIWSADRSCSPKEFLNLLHIFEPPEAFKVESQVPLKGNFEVNREYFSTHQEIKIDPNSCLDCALITKSSMIPIEVKSGVNLKDVFKDLNHISYSNTGELSGNMVKILNLEVSGHDLLLHKSSQYPDLDANWIMVVRSDTEARKVKSSLAEHKMPVILTLNTIQKYLEKNGLTGIILEQIVKEYLSLYAEAAVSSKKAA